MIWALLIALGVELIVIVVFAVFVVGRRRWLKKQPGTFAGAIRVSGGEVAFLKPEWKRGSGRWASNVLVWSKAPLLFATELIPVDGLVGEREMEVGDVKRLGDHPFAVEFATGDAKVEVAARPEGRALVTGSLTAGSATTPATTPSVKSVDRHRQTAARRL